MLLAADLASALELKMLIEAMERMDEKSRSTDELIDIMTASGYAGVADEIDELKKVELHVNDNGGPVLVATFTYTEDGETEEGNFYIKYTNGKLTGDY